MGILNTEINYDSIITDLGKCCLGESNCKTCNKDECIVGYAQKCIVDCFKKSITYVENGSEKIPVTDLKMYNVENFEKGIAHILRQCRSCQYEHFDNCIINIIRNCYEVGLFGEILGYEGSNFRYLNEIHNQYPEKAEEIIAEFHNAKED